MCLIRYINSITKNNIIIHFYGGYKTNIIIEYNAIINTELTDEKIHTGLIAQEVEKVIPEVVFEDAGGYKSVSYSNITAMLVESIKDLKTLINTLLILAGNSVN